MSRREVEAPKEVEAFQRRIKDGERLECVECRTLITDYNQVTTDLGSPRCTNSLECSKRKYVWCHGYPTSCGKQVHKNEISTFRSLDGLLVEGCIKCFKKYNPGICWWCRRPSNELEEKDQYTPFHIKAPQCKVKRPKDKPRCYLVYRMVYPEFWNSSKREPQSQKPVFQ